MFRTIIFAAAIALSGCATCERHQDACNAIVIGVGAAVVAGLAAKEWHQGGCFGCAHPLPQVRIK